MDTSKFISKTAYSKEGSKLGIIIRIEGRETANVLSEKPHAVVKVSRFLVLPDIIEIPLDKVIKIEVSRVFFKTTKKEFEELQRIYRLHRKRNLKAAKEKTQVKEDFDKVATRTMSRGKGLW